MSEKTASAMNRRILIMAGGTGGHVYPALAVADYLRKRDVSVSWLGTRKGLEARVVAEADFPLHTISVSGLRGKGFTGWLLAPLRLNMALMQALMILLRLRPHAVLGMGGFVTGPGGLAAFILSCPLLIHEQNAVAGLTNRLLSRIADRVLAAFPGAFRKAGLAEVVGNPVRESIGQLPAPAERFAERKGRLNLLVIGGSLGALALNKVLPATLQNFDAAHRPHVWHQTGAGKLAATEADYEQRGLRANVVEFIDDMDAAYAWADLVICRAGALTISELAIAGLGSILVPYPHAVDDHQTANADFLVRAGAAKLLPQAQMSADSLYEMLSELMKKGRRGLLKMALAARGAAMPEATRLVAERCLEAANG